jgi:hypothetical protein
VAFVPDDFTVPTTLVTADFRLEPLGEQHNEPDYAAWTSSIDHILATPGFADWGWPDAALTLEDNRCDLVKHAREFAERVGFTYTVVEEPSGETIGCVYIYPTKDAGHDVKIRSWVRADRAGLDRPLWQAVSDWVAADWPFESPAYAAR